MKKQDHVNGIWLKIVLTILIPFSSSFAQERLYELSESKVMTTSFDAIEHDLKLIKTEKPLQATLANPIILEGLNSLVRFLPKLIYNPSKYIAENQATFNFFKNEQDISQISEDTALVLTINATNGNNDAIDLGGFVFEIGPYKAHEGYYYMGLKEYRLTKTLAKLKPKSPRVNLVLEVLFEYYDANDAKQEFVLEPFYLNAIQVPSAKALKNPNYQLLPKMKVLESVIVKITEVNSKKENWDKWLGLYEKHQGKLPSILR